METPSQQQYQTVQRMTADEFTNHIDGLINDFRDGASSDKEFRDGILDILLQVAQPHLGNLINRSAVRLRILATLNQYRDECHGMAVSKGFHDRKKALPEMLMLIVSELGECCEADRKEKCTEPIRDFVSIMLEEKSDERFVQQFKLSVKDTVEDELADALIRIFDTAGALGIDLDAHVRAKMRYNSTRPIVTEKLTDMVRIQKNPFSNSLTALETADLTQAIIKYIRVQGGYAVRINCFGIYDQKTGRWRKSTTERGTADIHACFEGWHLSIEVKKGSDHQSDHQKRAEDQVMNAGGFYVIVSEFSEFHAWFLELKTKFRQ